MGHQAIGKLHLFGASGSGTTSLGRALSDHSGIPHLDTDDYYWKQTDPPFLAKNAPAERVRLIERDVADLSSWVLSGSLCSWGDALLHHFTLAIFLSLDPNERMVRLARREQERYGDRIAPGGDMHRQHIDFMDWAAGYDTASPPIRSLQMHKAWMKTLRCPIIELDSSQSVDALVEIVLDVCGPDRRSR